MRYFTNYSLFDQLYDELAFVHPLELADAQAKLAHGRKRQLDRKLNHRNRDGRHGSSIMHSQTWTRESLVDGEMSSRMGVMRAIPHHDYSDGGDERSGYGYGNGRQWLCDEGGVVEVGRPWVKVDLRPELPTRALSATAYHKRETRAQHKARVVARANRQKAKWDGFFWKRTPESRAEVLHQLSFAQLLSVHHRYHTRKAQLEADKAAWMKAHDWMNAETAERLCKATFSTQELLVEQSRFETSYEAA